MTRAAFETCKTITYDRNGEIVTARVVGRSRPFCGLRELRTDASDRVKAIDVLIYC